MTKPSLHLHERLDVVPIEQLRESTVALSLGFLSDAVRKIQEGDVHGYYDRLSITDNTSDTQNNSSEYVRQQAAEARSNINIAYSAHGGRQPAYEVDQNTRDLAA